MKNGHVDPSLAIGDINSLGWSSSLDICKRREGRDRVKL